MVNLKHYDNTGTARFITFSCYRRYRLLSKKNLLNKFLGHLETFRMTHELLILGYVLMPNHIHLVIYPQREVKLGPLIGRLKSGFAFEVISEWKSQNYYRLPGLEVIRAGKESYALWQLRCYDHNCRTPDKVREKIHYCHMNPVKAGLVDSPEKWKWSSYNWYNGKKDGTVFIDEVDGLC